MANMTLSDVDLSTLLTLLRGSDRPLSTDELVAALRERTGR